MQKKIILGLMRIANKTKEEVYELINLALSLGINSFDLADIYGGGESERIFGEALAMNKDLRNKMFIQSKVGICSGYYDSSYEHIIDSAKAILKRLQIDYLDCLLIHRPDFLASMDEIKQAFDYLYENGLVKSFGVSNMNPYQIELLEKTTGYKMKKNQLQFSIVHSQMVKNDISFNMTGLNAYDTTLSIFSYLKLHSIILEAWSPLMASWEEGCFIDHPKYQILNDYLAELALKYKVSKNAIAVAWILRVPTDVGVVIGTTNPIHLKEITKALDIELGRDEWYQLFQLAGNRLP